MKLWSKIVFHGPGAAGVAEVEGVVVVVVVGDVVVVVVVVGGVVVVVVVVGGVVVVVGGVVVLVVVVGGAGEGTVANEAMVVVVVEVGDGTVVVGGVVGVVGVVVVVVVAGDVVVVVEVGDVAMGVPCPDAATLGEATYSQLLAARSTIVLETGKSRDDDRGHAHAGVRSGLDKTLVATRIFEYDALLTAPCVRPRCDGLPGIPVVDAA